MDIDQLKSDWQQQLVQPSSVEQLDWEENMVEIENKMMALNRNVKSRTLYGTITFVLMLVSMIALGYFSFLLSKSLMLTLGLTTWIVGFIVTMVRLFLVRRINNMSYNMLTIKESLQHKLLKVESEIQFYLSIVWKILAPMSIGLVLILIGTNASLQMAVGQMTLFILGCYWSYRYNKYYVAKNLTPIKNELTSTLKTISNKD